MLKRGAGGWWRRSGMRIKPGQTGYKRWEKQNRPPAGEPWVWHTRGMMESPAWWALTAPARRVVDRIAVEHMHHAGTMNGELVVTYDDFQDFGISRRAIRTAIDVAVALGWIDVTVQGVRSYGNARRPSKYAVTWLPHNDAIEATNRWAAIKSRAEASAVVANIHSKAKFQTQTARVLARYGARCGRASRAPSTQDIKGSALNDTGEVAQKTAIASAPNDTGLVPKTTLALVPKTTLGK